MQVLFFGKFQKQEAEKVTEKSNLRCPACDSKNVVTALGNKLDEDGKQSEPQPLKNTCTECCLIFE